MTTINLVPSKLAISSLIGQITFNQNSTAPMIAILKNHDHDMDQNMTNDICRISKKVWNNTGGTGDPVVNLKFVYDQWNLIAELNAPSSLLRAYMWGLDLSGTIQGAGGVGGLLAVNDTTNGAHFVCYDGNGNVAALLHAPSSALHAVYEYGPFGEPVRITGPMGKTNPIRFSTKYTDDESGFLYYGRRYYDPSTGRWLSRDPAKEFGGVNLYGFVENQPVNCSDALGLFSHAHNCTEKQLTEIRAAETKSMIQIRKARLALPQFEVEEVSKRNSSFASRVTKEFDFKFTYVGWKINLIRTINSMDRVFAENKYGVECECWCTGDKLGYVRDWAVYLGIDDDIHFCPPFFDRNADKQAEAFMHEASHLALTDDLMLSGGIPWDQNPIDAYWIEDLGYKDPVMYFNDWIVYFTRNFGRIK